MWRGIEELLRGENQPRHSIFFIRSFQLKYKLAVFQKRQDDRLPPIHSRKFRRLTCDYQGVNVNVILVGPNPHRESCMSVYFSFTLQ